MHDTFANDKKFEWQEGYAAFSVSPSQVAPTVAYINNQKEHHRKKTFEEEFIQLLDKHGIPHDKRYVFSIIQPSASRTPSIFTPDPTDDRWDQRRL